VRLSPDGTHIAAIHARDGVQTLVVRASHGGEVRPLATLDREGMRGPDAGLGQQRASPGELRDAEYLPTVVSTQGGPWSRDVWGYRPDVQYLASRGFAVFQLNFRGSTGYGTRHERLGYRKWGLDMQDDVTDGVRWLIAQGIADPNRIGIYGASYGGYAALMGLAKTPELFRAGASLRA
jgi:dipeptidyl aminopeptidase/acylaminoacyl peptidase